MPLYGNYRHAEYGAFFQTALILPINRQRIDIDVIISVNLKEQRIIVNQVEGINHVKDVGHAPGNDQKRERQHRPPR